jgi:hypothetical protein
VVVGVVGVVVVVVVVGFGAARLAVVVCLRVAAGADLAAVDVVAGASGTPDPIGLGASPIESREIALAARPTATARASPTTLSRAVRSALGLLMTQRWASWPVRPGRWAPGR